ncbi:signal transduction histidine kinase [Lipingzhangella halophila]|uniref:histidine kinase n=1 Tax=Lipingzhangella halophila TaxID=1783352 RepID=A0A7W7RI73_9ACTN|nr:histidine kinase [Lipingzhangella halophila]MBB4932362.1 signal transduction histidine kinase [Lipingzhangella halophila]
MAQPATSNDQGRVAWLAGRAGPVVLAVAVVAGSLWTAVDDNASQIDAATFLDLDRWAVAGTALVLAVACVAAIRRAPRGLAPLFALAFAGQVGLSMWPPLVVASYFAATTLRQRAHLVAFAVAAGAVLTAPAGLGAALSIGAAGWDSVRSALGGVALFVVLPIVVGLWLRARREVVAGLRERAAYLEREQIARSERARVQERSRIAREMHDVVAHRVSLMVMQAGAIQANASDPGVAADAATLRSTGREALTQLREVLGVLHSPGPRETGEPVEPQPTLEGLDTLLDRSRSAGVPVDRHDTGEPGDLPALVERTAYRVVQEALTNVHRHAGGARTDVVLHHSPEELVVTVRNAAPHPVEAPLPGSGMGLVGLRERVELLGGALSSHRDDDGGFTLSARLPVAGAAPAGRQ